MTMAKSRFANFKYLICQHIYHDYINCREIGASDAYVNMVRRYLFLALLCNDDTKLNYIYTRFQMLANKYPFSYQEDGDWGYDDD